MLPIFLSIQVKRRVINGNKSRIQQNKANTTGACKKCLFYGNVRFIEIPFENEYIAQIKRKVDV